MEHLKKRLKLKPQYIKNTSKYFGVPSKIYSKFKQEANVGDNKDYDTFLSNQKDLMMILEKLT